MSMKITCGSCGRLKSHYAKGLCRKCYQKAYQKAYQQTEKCKAYQKAYRKNLRDHAMKYRELMKEGK